MDKNEVDFEKIFKKYYRRMCFYARKFIDDDDLAEDIVQEVFSNLWERHQIFELDVVLRAYLFKSVYNRCLNHLNRQKLIQKHFDVINKELKEIEIEYYGSEKNNVHSLFELEVKIEDAIALLPDQCRNVFELSRTKGLKNREIAELLNISIKVVEKHITKALVMLREDLKDYLTVILIVMSMLKNN